MNNTDFKTGLWGLSWESLEGGDHVQGIANLVDNEIALSIPIGKLLGEWGIRVIGAPTPPCEVDYLYGFTQDGYHCVIGDAFSAGGNSSFPGMESQQIRGKYLLATKGGSFDPAGLVDKVSFALTGLKGWLGITPFSMKLDERYCFKSLELCDGEEWEDEVLLDCAYFSVQVSHVCYAPPFSVDSMLFRHDVAVLVDFSEAVPLEEARRVASRISNFFSFAQGFLAEIERFSFWQEDGGGEIRCFFPRLRSKGPTDRQLRSMPFAYFHLKDRINDLLGKWMDSGSGLDEIESMLVSLMMNDWLMPVDMEFSAASQLLEAVSKHDVDLLSMPKEQFELQKAMLNSVASLLPKNVESWAKERIGQNQKGQDRLLREFLERYEVYTNWLIPDARGFVNRQKAARNWYTHRHGGAEPLDTDDLFWHTQVILLLVYGILWMKLGMNGDVVIERLKAASFKDHIVRKSHGMYAASV